MKTTKEDRGWSVYERGDGGWCINFRLAPGDWKDRRIPREEAHTERQAEKWARANVERLRAGEPTKPKGEGPAVVRVRDLEDAYLKIRRGLGLRPATIQQDECSMRAHIVKKLGDEPVADLDSAKLLTFVDKLKAEGRGASSIRNILSVLRNFLDVVRVRKLAPVASNPTRDPEFIRQGVPRRQRATKPQLTLAAAEMLLTHDEVPEHWRVRILIGCTSGLRDGEIAGLQWQDADLDAPVPCLHVRKARALVREKDEETGPTKNAGSNRDVPIHPLAVKALRVWKGRGWVEWVGRHAQAHDFVFPSERGEVWRPRSAEALRALLLAAGCEATYAGKPIDFHALRRSFATWLARAGVERAIRKMLLGHIQGDVSEDHYIERDLAMLHEAVCRIRLDLTRGKVIALPRKAASEGQDR